MSDIKDIQSKYNNILNVLGGAYDAIYEVDLDRDVCISYKTVNDTFDMESAGENGEITYTSLIKKCLDELVVDGGGAMKMLLTPEKVIRRLQNESTFSFPFAVMVGEQTFYHEFRVVRIDPFEEKHRAVMAVIDVSEKQHLIQAYKTSEYEKENAEQLLAVVNGLCLEYAALWIISVDDLKIKLHGGASPILTMLKEASGAENLYYDDARKWYIKNFIIEEDRDRVLDMSRPSVVYEKIKSDPNSMYTITFIRQLEGRVNYHQVCYAKANKGEEFEYFVMAFRNIDEVIKREQELKKESRTDELTGFLNRRAFEEDIAGFENPAGVSQKRDFVFISMDVNGLKQINDSLGHAAGDELLTGASECIRRVFGTHGRVYRIGGDEFAAVIFADPEKLIELKDDFDQTCISWKGEVVDSLTISAGYVSRSEALGKSITDMIKIADKRMYDAKSAYYNSNGIDRRGQREAYSIIAKTYTKILKVDLLKDEYKIIQMPLSEQNVDSGFRDTISDWLYAFALSGQIHDDDCEEYLQNTQIDYLRSLFRSGKESHVVRYRRQIDGKYEPVMMEIIPTDDYSETNQIVYLYVKKIQ